MPAVIKAAGTEAAAVQETIIEARDICFGYTGEQILYQVGFAVNKGDFVSIIGSNGSGKSTLLRLILGELSPVQGGIRLFGEDVAHFKAWPKIGFVPQNGFRGNMGFPATAEEIVLANLYSEIGLFRLPNKAQREKARHALEQVHMEAHAKRLFGELSGGQQQRVMLARVLVSGPELLLLDEPTTGVDAQTVETLYALLSRYNREQGVTVVMVTHDMGRAAAHVSRVLCLEESSLVELQPEQVAEELTHRHTHPARCTHKGE